MTATAAPDTKKLGLIATVAAVLDATGYDDVRSRFRNENLLVEVQGTQSNEKPDLFAEEPQPRRSIIVETVTLKELGDPERLKRRLYLFYTASETYGWEFHLACYATVKEALARFCARWGIRYTRIWGI